MSRLDIQEGQGGGPVGPRVAAPKGDHPDGAPRPNFREVFLRRRRLPNDRFERALFFECAPLHVLLAGLFCDQSGMACLAPDRQLMARVGDACSIEEVEAVISSQARDPANATWMRRTAGFRVSIERLRGIAQRCLPARAAGRHAGEAP